MSAAESGNYPHDYLVSDPLQVLAAITRTFGYVLASEFVFSTVHKQDLGLRGARAGNSAKLQR
jgi:hypothetical protein